MLAVDDCATTMIMQVHDELVFEVPDAELDWAREALPALNVRPSMRPCRARQPT